MYNGVIFRTKEEANMCLSKMKETIMKRGYVTVDEMYHICEIPIAYNCNFDKFVWTNLEGTTIKKGGPYWWIISFPDPIRIEDIKKEEGLKLSPKEFAKQMQQIKDRFDGPLGDFEEQHIRMDALLCAQLRGLGYGEAVDIYINTEKYYA